MGRRMTTGISAATSNCVMCLKPLTAEEKHAYEYRCEACHGKWMDRLISWMRGRKDTELDKVYGVLKRVRR